MTGYIELKGNKIHLKLLLPMYSSIWLRDGINPGKYVGRGL